MDRRQHTDPATRDMRLVRALLGAPLAHRWLAVDVSGLRHGMLHDFAPAVRQYGPAAVSAALDRFRGLACRHVLPVEHVRVEEQAPSVWALTPYPGNDRELVTLRGLLEARPAAMPVYEVARAVEQLLTGLSTLHEAGIVGAAFDDRDVLVDPRGGLLLSFHGLDAVLTGERATLSRRELVRDDLACVGSIAFRLLTRLDADETRPPLNRLVVPDGALWEAWIARALDVVDGFTSSTEALAVLPSRGALIEGRVPASAPGPARIVAAGLRRAISALRGPEGRRRGGAGQDPGGSGVASEDPPR